jgi:hypothetical protein
MPNLEKVFAIIREALTIYDTTKVTITADGDVVFEPQRAYTAEAMDREDRLKAWLDEHFDEWMSEGVAAYYND